MKRYSDEQLEEILQGRQPEPADLDTGSKRRVAEMRAVRERLRSAFASVHAGGAFAERLGQRLTAAAKPTPVRRPTSRRVLRPWFWRVGLPAVAAAAVLLIGVPLWMHWSGPGDSSAQAALVGIHRSILSPPPGMEFIEDDDPERVASWLKERVGVAPTVPCGSSGAAVKCCCVSKFRGKRVGSYMLQCPKGAVTVVLTEDTPGSMRLRHSKVRNGWTFWTCEYGPCKIAATRVGNLTYCVVGETSHDVLLGVLDQILGTGATPAGAPALPTGEPAATPDRS